MALAACGEVRELPQLNLPALVACGDPVPPQGRHRVDVVVSALSGLDLRELPAGGGVPRAQKGVAAAAREPAAPKVRDRHDVGRVTSEGVDAVVVGEPPHSYR